MPKQKTNDQEWRSRGKMKLKMRETEKFRVRGKKDKKTWIREEEKTDISSVQFSPTVMSMDCSIPGFPVYHQLPELAQTHVHWVSDAIQSSHPVSSPSPPAFNLSQHQRLFQWVSSLHQVAKLLKLQLQHQSLWMNIQDWFPFRLTGLISLQSKRSLSLLQHHSSKASAL